MDDIREAEIQETGRIVREIIRRSGVRCKKDIVYDDKGRSLYYYVMLVSPNKQYFYKAVFVYQYSSDLFDCFILRIDNETFNVERTEIATGMYADSLPEWINRTWTDKKKQWYPYQTR